VRGRAGGWGWGEWHSDFGVAFAAAQEALIRPAGSLKPTLTEQLDQFDPAKHAGEAMAAGRVGTEIF